MPFLFFDKTRLKQKEQFQNVFKRGKKVSLNKCSFFLVNNNLEYPRLGMVILKKYVRTAVARNRIKRIVRESLRLQQKNLGGMDFVFFAYKGLDQIANEELRQCLEKFWHQNK